MLRYALRRTLWAIPTLLGISLVVFFVTSLLPDPAADLPKRAAALVASDPEELRRARGGATRALPRPPRRSSTRSPQDVRTRATAAMRHVADDDDRGRARRAPARRGWEARRSRSSCRRSTICRRPRAARVAVALAPIGLRMGVAAEDRLERPERGGPLLDAASGRTARSTSRHRASPRRAPPHAPHDRPARARPRARSIRTLSSAVIPAMHADRRPRGDPRAGGARVARERATRRDPFRRGRRRAPPRGRGWNAWWQVHESDYVAYDGAARVAAASIQTRYGKWILGAATGRLGTSAIDGVPIADEAARADARDAAAHAARAAPAATRSRSRSGRSTAWLRGRPVDVTLAIVLFAMYSLPTFWAAQLLAHAYARAARRGAPRR